MKTTKVENDFIREAYKEACSNWKDKLDKKFPKLKLKGHENPTGWFVNDNFPDWMGYFKDGYMQYKTIRGGKWVDIRAKGYNLHIGDGYNDNDRLADLAEVERRLFKYANSIGLRLNTKIEAHAGRDVGSLNSGEFIPQYCHLSNTITNRNGYIFRDGYWATPLKEEKPTKENTEDGWYLDDASPKWMKYFENGKKIYGFNGSGYWCGIEEDHYGGQVRRNRPAAKEEIEDKLWEYARKIGFSKTQEILFHPNGYKSYNHGATKASYRMDHDSLFSIHGMIYSKGKWGKPQPEYKTLEEYEKKIKEAILTRSASPEPFIYGIKEEDDDIKAAIQAKTAIDKAVFSCNSTILEEFQKVIDKLDKITKK